jgi:hypothetical protein
MRMYVSTFRGVPEHKQSTCPNGRLHLLLSKMRPLAEGEADRCVFCTRLDQL